MTQVGGTTDLSWNPAFPEGDAQTLGFLSHTATDSSRKSPTKQKVGSAENDMMTFRAPEGV